MMAVVISPMIIAAPMPYYTHAGCRRTVLYLAALMDAITRFIQLLLRRTEQHSLPLLLPLLLLLLP